jgi:nucleoside-diphosphate-sugar epimerase
MAGTKLVIGASGFLGSHVVKQLVARGDDVRVLIRATSSTRGIDGLVVDVRHGDIFDTESLRAASSIGTIGRVENGLADESTAHNWLDVGGDYIRSRVAAEAMVLAGERGRIGERYIVSERFMSTREVHEIACNAVGVAPPKWGIPIRLMSAAAHVSSLVARLRGKDTKLTPLSILLMHIMTPLDHSKAVRELGWHPRPTPEAIVAAAHFFRDARRRPAAAGEPR